MTSLTHHTGPGGSRWWQGALALLGLLMLLSSCGGGGVGEGGTGSFASGPISGFGSVHVGGIRFDDSSIESVAVEDEASPVPPSALRPGMVVAIDAGEIRTDAAGVRRAVAQRIVLAGSLRGPVTDVQWSERQLRVLGLPVRFNAATVFDDRLREQIRESGRILDQVVEVWGYVDRSGVVPQFVATYMASAAAAPTYKARGFVREVNDELVRLGDQWFDFSGVSGRPAVGDFVWLRVPPGSGMAAWPVQAWATIDRSDFTEGRRLTIEGLVTAMDDARHFRVDGLPVVAEQAVAGLALGRYVEVEGTWRARALRADEVEIKDDDERLSEWEGTVSQLDAVLRQFRLSTDGGRSVLVTYDASTVFEGGSVGDLGPGDRVEVKGVLRDGALQAREIEFDD